MQYLVVAARRHLRRIGTVLKAHELFHFGEARLSNSMSNFFIFRKAFMTRCDVIGSGSINHFQQRKRNDLPREAVFVFQPAAGTLLAMLGKLAPEMIAFRLCLAIDLEEKPPRRT